MDTNSDLRYLQRSPIILLIRMMVFHIKKIEFMLLLWCLRGSIFYFSDAGFQIRPTLFNFLFPFFFQSIDVNGLPLY